MARSAVYSLFVRAGAMRASLTLEEPMLGGPQDIPEPHRSVITVLIYALVLAVAFVVEDLGQLLTFSGALAGSLVIFFFPAAISWTQFGGSAIYEVAAVVFFFSG